MELKNAAKPLWATLKLVQARYLVPKPRVLTIIGDQLFSIRGQENQI